MCIKKSLAKLTSLLLFFPLVGFGKVAYAMDNVDSNDNQSVISNENNENNANQGGEENGEAQEQQGSQDNSEDNEDHDQPGQPAKSGLFGSCVNIVKNNPWKSAGVIIMTGLSVAAIRYLLCNFENHEAVTGVAEEQGSEIDDFEIQQEVEVRA